MGEKDIGVVGLGVMGLALALNLKDNGKKVVGSNRSAGPRERARAAGLDVVDTLDAMATELARPRVVLLSVPAGAAVDTVIEGLAPHLEDGDIVIDSGNSHYTDSERRTAELAKRGILFSGTGVSGGEEGARHGPAIMVGCAEQAYGRLKPLFDAIAAKFEGEPCSGWMGPGGAGHFVKMVHNGIEYADMQLIAEIDLVLRDGMGFDEAGSADTFARWNEGPLASYLVEITAEVLRARDPATDEPVVRIIADRAGQKGTGRWTGLSAIELGVPAPSIIAAVQARALSSATAARHEASSGRDHPPARIDLSRETLADALLAAKISAYAQGFMLLSAAAQEHGWPFRAGAVAAVWRAGCIIRARLLDDIMHAAERGMGPAGLLAAAPLSGMIDDALPGLRATVAACAKEGIPAPALSSALAWIDGMRAPKVGASLIQAQRDFFGAHGFERIDKEGQFHLDGSGS